MVIEDDDLNFLGLFVKTYMSCYYFHTIHFISYTDIITVSAGIGIQLLSVCSFPNNLDVGIIWFHVLFGYTESNRLMSLCKAAVFKPVTNDTVTDMYVI